MPTFYVIEQTNNCVLRCCYCPNRMNHRKKGVMTPETFKNIVNGLLELDEQVKEKRVCLHGIGEPLLSQHLWENLEYLEEKQFKQVDFVTNGVLLNQEITNKINSFSCLKEVRISLNSSRKDIMERLNTGADFDQVVGNIKKFWTSKFVIQLMISKLNHDETEEEMLNFLGKKCRIKMNKLHTFRGLFEEDDVCFPEYTPCTGLGRESLFFHWDGDYVGCCGDDTKWQVLGNIKDGIKLENNFKELPLCLKCLKMK